MSVYENVWLHNSHATNPGICKASVIMLHEQNIYFELWHVTVAHFIDHDYFCYILLGT